MTTTETDGRQINFYCEGGRGNEDYGRLSRPHARREVATFFSNGTRPDGSPHWELVTFDDDDVTFEIITRDAHTGKEVGPTINPLTRLDTRGIPELAPDARTRFVIRCADCASKVNMPSRRERLFVILEGITQHVPPIADMHGHRVIQGCAAPDANDNAGAARIVASYENDVLDNGGLRLWAQPVGLLAMRRHAGT